VTKSDCVIAPLREGPLDIVGDVHGELSALKALLGHLGYNKTGLHTDGRTLVFVGDLCDRGHDSPAVFDFVMRLVNGGSAQCVLGNHELNLLREEPKEGNGWFFERHKDHDDELLKTSARVGPEQRDAIHSFLSQLPVALERQDLRVVHACWHGSSVDALRYRQKVIDVYRDYEAQTDERLAAGLEARAEEEAKRFERQLEDKAAKGIPMLEAIAESDELYQMGNPVRVMTSGVERRTTKPFFAGGKWRFVERIPWWDEYEDEVPVVVGHYWRWRNPEDRADAAKDGPDLFDGIPADSWMGSQKKVFCVDYSVGYRHKERHRGKPHQAWLAALRWPERVVMFDDGKEIRTS
jgi:hypothetical protein